MALQQLGCIECGLTVKVEKFSEAHTSIQWPSDVSSCPFLSDEGRPQASGKSCPQLGRSIDKAVHERVLVETLIELPTGAAIPRM